jgi:hypothetical protein
MQSVDHWIVSAVSAVFALIVLLIGPGTMNLARAQQNNSAQTPQAVKQADSGPPPLSETLEWLKEKVNSSARGTED